MPELPRSAEGHGPTNKPAFLVLQHDPAQRARLTSLLLANGLRVFPAATGEIALTILREHHARIVCVITDPAVPHPVSGHIVPYWFRFYNPVGPVIYVTDDPASLTDAIQGSVVLHQSCGAHELIRAIGEIRTSLALTKEETVRALRH